MFEISAINFLSGARCVDASDLRPPIISSGIDDEYSKVGMSLPLKFILCNALK